MNKLFIIGNLTADPETRTTKEGTTVCSFTVAVNRKNKSANAEADFFRVSAWRQLGEVCRMYLAKGRKVSVVGEIHAGAYTNSKGEAVGTLEVTAQDIEFLSPKDTEAQYQREERQAIQDEAKGYVKVDNEELPF
jgi:single-strand DNA-binding protein